MRHDHLSATCVCVSDYTHCNASVLHFFFMNDMEEKGIVASDCLPLEPRFPLPAARCRGTTASALPAAGGGGA